MPQSVRVQKGCSIDYTPGSAVSAGDVVVQNGLVGVAEIDIAANALGALAIEGIFDFTKQASASVIFAIGDPSYWDDSNNRVVADHNDGANAFVGTVVKAAGDTATTARIKLNDQSSQAGAGSGALTYSQEAASAAVTNTTVQTAFDKSYTIPASTLRPGDVIRVRAQGIATATNSTDTLNAILRIGTVDVIATAALDVADNDIFVIDADIVIRTNGASGTFVAGGSSNIGVPGTATTKAKSKASTAIDTTATQSVNVTATWSVASASNSCRLDILDVQILSKA
jgi:predicted RecA/RadA family phage recombinase